MRGIKTTCQRCNGTGGLHGEARKALSERRGHENGHNTCDLCKGYGYDYARTNKAMDELTNQTQSAWRDER